MKKLTEQQRLFKDKVDKVLEEIGTVLLAKNISYGNSALEPINIFSKLNSKEQINIRLDDKLSRLAKGSEFEQEDTKLDIIGYLILDRMLDN